MLPWTTLSGCGGFYIDGGDEGPAGVSGVEDEVGRSIVADCVVTFYKADGSIYLSEQKHTIYPQSQGLEISGTEPGGQFTWTLFGGDFRIVEGTANVGELSGVMYDRKIAKLILTSIVAGSGMSAQLSVSSELVKIQGRWYNVIEVAPGTTYAKTLKSFEVPWAKLTLYGDGSSGVIDRVVIEDLASGETLMAHSYNFRWLDGIGRTIPMKIDIFKMDTDQAEQQGFLSIAYHAVRTQ
ncbi:MAG: hypothetical protein DRP65_07145 [Planctomycetota bacterium]|nr:MAG: hypothetical protein DRP65_07145 [Planctomycetota bacterium]